MENFYLIGNETFYENYSISVVKCFTSKKLAEEYIETYKRYKDVFDNLGNLNGSNFEMLDNICKTDIISIDLDSFYNKKYYDIDFEEYRYSGDSVKKVKNSDQITVICGDPFNHFSGEGYNILSILTRKEDVESFIIDEYKTKAKYKKVFRSSLNINNIRTRTLDDPRLMFIIRKYTNGGIFIGIETTEEDDIFYYNKYNQSGYANIQFMESDRDIEDMIRELDEKYYDKNKIRLPETKFK